MGVNTKSSMTLYLLNVIFTFKLTPRRKFLLENFQLNPLSQLGFEILVTGTSWIQLVTGTSWKQLVTGTSWIQLVQLNLLIVNIELSQIERGRILGRGAVKCNCSRHTSRGSQRIEGFCPGGGSLSTWPATHPRPEKASKRVPFQAFRRRRRLLEKEYPFHRRSSQSTLRVSFHYLCRRLEMLFRVCWIRHLE